MKRLLLVLTILSGITLMPGVCIQAQTVATATPKDNLLTLKANYPNPYNEQTTILFSLARPETVKITLYTVLGSRISTILHESLEAGEHEILFKRPESLPDGIYIYTIEAGRISRSMRMIVRK